MTDINRTSKPLEGFEVVCAEPGDLEGMAQAHIASFPDQFASRMGPRYLKAFYASYLNKPDGIALVARNKSTGKVLGLIVGGDPSIRKNFIKRGARRFLPLLAVKFFTDSKVRSSFIHKMANRLRIRTSAHNDEKKDAPIPDHANGPRSALLQVICVLAEGRGSGIASDLMESFRQACRQADYPVMYLTVLSSNVRAISLYRKCGWNVKTTIDETTIMERPTSEDASN